MAKSTPPRQILMKTYRFTYKIKTPIAHRITITKHLTLVEGLIHPKKEVREQAKEYWKIQEEKSIDK